MSDTFDHEGDAYDEMMNERDYEYDSIWQRGPLYIYFPEEPIDVANSLKTTSLESFGIKIPNNVRRPR
jgi:hypothetical protein